VERVFIRTVFNDFLVLLRNGCDTERDASVYRRVHNAQGSIAVERS